MLIACLVNDGIDIISLINGTEQHIKTDAQWVQPLIRFFNHNQVLYFNLSNELCVYHIGTQESEIIYHFDEHIRALAVKGDFIAVGAGKTVLVITRQGELLHELKGCRTTISDIVFLNHSHSIAATGDKKIHMWDLGKKKPKSTPITGLFITGMKLSLSEDDRYIVASHVNGHTADVFDIESKAKTYSSSESIGQFAGPSLLYDGCLIMTHLSEIISINLETGTTEVIQDSLNVVNQLRAINDVLIIAESGRIILLNRGDQVYHETQLNNTSGINCLFRWKDNIVSLGRDDVVMRSLTGEGLASQKIPGETFMDIVPTTHPDIVWIAAKSSAFLFNLETMTVIKKTPYFKGLGPVVTKLADDITVFCSAGLKHSYGGVVAYDDQAEEVFRCDKVNLRGSVSTWVVDDSHILILSPRQYVLFNTQTHKVKEHHNNGTLIGQAHVDLKRSKVYLYESESVTVSESKTYIKCVSLDFKNVSNGEWKVQIDGFLPLGWFSQDESLLLKADNSGDLFTFDLATKDISSLGLNEPDVSCYPIVESGSIILGLESGEVKVAEYLEPTL